MKIVEQKWEWVLVPARPLEIIELAGRTCYKSEHRITPGSAEKFVAMILAMGHESVIEHVSASVRFITNRGVTHELVRSRLASYAQESTRYVRYSGEVEFVRPVWWQDPNYTEIQKEVWLNAMLQSETSYLAALAAGDKPEQAREILPNALKTEIVVTANLREWRHIFKIRTSAKAHPQIRELMLDCLQGFRKEIPVVFEKM